jgi:hypothetical protein
MPSSTGGDDGCGKEAFNFCEGRACKNENKARREANRQEKAGRNVRYCRRMQADCDAACKGSGNRNGGQLHEVLRNLTRVSM